jgi:hypothetical protein
LLKREQDKWDDDLSEMQEQDWWCYRNLGPMATHRDNQLVHDLTKTGTLFRLWNAYRFNKKDKILRQMIVTYLRWLSKESTMFEEEIEFLQGGESCHPMK